MAKAYLCTRHRDLHFLDPILRVGCAILDGYGPFWSAWKQAVEPTAADVARLAGGFGPWWPQRGVEGVGYAQRETAGSESTDARWKAPPETGRRGIPGGGRVLSAEYVTLLPRFVERIVRTVGAQDNDLVLDASRSLKTKSWLIGALRMNQLCSELELAMALADWAAAAAVARRHRTPFSPPAEALGDVPELRTALGGRGRSRTPWRPDPWTVRVHHVQSPVT